MLLKRQFSLVALVVELETLGRTALVRLALEATEYGEARVLWSTALEAQQIGLTPRITGGQPDAGVDGIVLPDEVSRAIGGALLSEGYDGPLWLHLIKPYGVLGALPWERLLVNCGHAILRLPDALAEAAVETPETLNVILCASRPRSEENFNIPACLALMAEKIVRSVSGREARVYVFADLECTQEITQRLNTVGLIDSHVIVIDPERSRDYKLVRSVQPASRVSTATSPWLQWMTKSMGGRSVDVVHFVCHGYMADHGGSLAFAESPVLNDDPQWCGFVGGSELSRFLIDLGAWSVAFTAPRHNYSPLGLRSLADELAQVRPGPVMHHESADDPDFKQLGDAYRLMYSNERISPEPAPAIALCCQPALVAGMRRARASITLSRAAFGKVGTDAEVSAISMDAAVDGAAKPVLDIPAWMASAHRFVEQKEYEIRRTRKTNQSYTTRSQQDLEGAARGVDEIKLTLERLMKKGVL